MEEANEMALTEYILGNLSDSGFDYEEMPQEKIIECETMAQRNFQKADSLKWDIAQTVTIVKRYCEEYYKGRSKEKWLEWCEKVQHIKQTMAYKYLYAYSVKINIDSKINQDLSFTQVKQLGISQAASLATLPEDQQVEIIKQVPLEDMTTRETDELVKKVKETGEYNKNLLNEIRQKDDKIKTTEAETKQLQQEKEQKDQEIAELKAKLQKIEEKAQPVAQVEPEVVEKIVEVEVEKVVKKEVIPDEIQEELKELRAEKKRLEQETAEKTEYIKQQDEKLQEKEDSLNNLKINKNTNQTENLNVIDIGILFTIIKDFLTRASSYTLLKGQYEDIPPKTKKTLEDAIKSVEDWCILMEQAVNSDFQNVGNNIIIESEND